MSDIDLAVTRSKRLERILREDFAAEGRGLHELVGSLDRRHKLPRPLVKRLRLIATVRNKIVHDLDYKKIDDRAGFEHACDLAERELRDLLGRRESFRIPLMVAALVAAFLLVGVGISIWLLRQYELPLW